MEYRKNQSRYMYILFVSGFMASAKQRKCLIEHMLKLLKVSHHKLPYNLKHTLAYTFL